MTGRMLHAHNAFGANLVAFSRSARTRRSALHGHRGRPHPGGARTIGPLSVPATTLARTRDQRCASIARPGSPIGSACSHCSSRIDPISGADPVAVCMGCPLLGDRMPSDLSPTHVGLSAMPESVSPGIEPARQPAAADRRRPVRETQAERTRPLTPTTRRMRRTRNTGLAGDRRCLSAAVLTGLEPAIFALTTRRALQLLRKTKARSVLSEKCQRGAPSLSVCCSDPADLVVGHWLQLRRVVVRLVVHDGMSFLRVGPTRCEPAIFALTTPTAPQDQDDGP